MKKVLLLAFVACSIVAGAQIKMPQPSPTQTLSQDFGLGKIEVTYSRPSVKGRAVFKEKSELAPLGTMWRTGANAVTKVKFTDKVMIGGKSIDTGTYALYTIPGKSEWEVILNKGLSNWGSGGYKESDDVVRFKVPTEKGKDVEAFTIQIADIKPESCNLQLAWANVVVNVPVTTNVKDRIRTQVEASLQADKVTAGTYFTAANFYYEWDKEYSKALPNVVKAIETTPKGYYMYLLKAKIENALGDKVAAKASAEKCITLATEEKNEDYVRGGQELLKKL